MTEEVARGREVVEAPKKKMRKRSSGPFTFEKVLGVALLGAISGVLIYYVYNHLGEDTRKAVKEAVVSGVKSQMKMKFLTPFANMLRRFMIWCMESVCPECSEIVRSDAPEEDSHR